MRQFKLKNSTGAELDLNRFYHGWLHDPDGLGWGSEPTNVAVGNTFVTIDESVLAPNPTGEMIFTSYENYQEFLEFIQAGGCVLCYMPISTWRYLDVDVQVEKSEIKPENNRLICPVTFIAKSYWYEQVQVYQANGEVLETDKTYAYQYDYTYGDIGSGSVVIQNGQLSSYFKLTIMGPSTNPYYRVFVGGDVYKEGRILATIADGNKLVVDTHPATMEIAEYTSQNAFVRDLYGESDFSTERIFELPAGRSVFTFTDESTAPPTAFVEVRKRV